ncbi:MAG: VOC family protein [Nocardioidaceae bacterium]
MSTRDTPFAPGTPCWVDLYTTDIDGAKAFYGGLFDWSFEQSGDEFGGYVTVRSDGHRVAGMMKNTTDPGESNAWSTYLSTEEIDATIQRAKAAGGSVVVEPMEIGDLGSMAMLTDPAGGFFGLWRPGAHFGFAKYNEPGSVTWDEYHSKDFATTTPFYADLFGWQVVAMSDTDEFRYSTGQIDGRDVVGMMDSSSFLPEEVPSHWAVYFNVADIDAAVAQVEQLGGSVVRPPADSPYGRMADVADPAGVMFKLQSAPVEG